MAYQPKSYKKFVATAATATLVATAVVPAAFADEVKTAAFTDVAPQYADAVEFVVAQNIAKGLTETTFGVSAQIKRGDAAIMIANAAGLNDEKAPQSGFSDVPTRGVLAINSLKKAGVVNGKSATNFGFNDSITRGEAAIMLANAFNLKGDVKNVKFTDVNDRYLAAVAALVEEGVTNGISATQFGTTNNIKRGDFARFVYALEEYIGVNPAAPVLSYDGTSTINVPYGTSLTLPTVTAKDDVDTNVEVKRVIKNAAGDVVTAIDTKKPGTYTVTYSAVDSDGNKAKDVVVTVVVAESIDGEVASVTSLNAKEVQVKFNQAVDKATVLDGSTVKNITFSVVGDATSPGALTGTLSEDGQTLTITAANSFKGSYTVVATDDIKTSNGETIEEFKSVLSFSDTVRPTVSQATYTANNVAKFTFSEPINVTDSTALASALTLKDASGATFTPVVNLSSDKKSFTLNLTGATFESDKSYTLSVTGLQDFAGNLISPNPSNLTVTKKVVDDVKPTVSSVTSTQAGYVVVNFSEKVAVGSGNVVATVGGVTADLDTNATLNAAGTSLTVRSTTFNGTRDITVADFADEAGNLGTAKTVLVSFPVDTVKPEVTSSSVKAINNQNYLILTFSEEVTVTNDAGSITGTYVTENGVEKTVTPISTASATNVSAVEGNKNQVKVLIDSQEKGTYSVSLPASLVADAVGNTSIAKAITYTVGANASETTKPTIVDTTPATADLDGIVVQPGTDNNTVTIQFSEQLSTTALNLNNFLVEGVAVASKAVFTDSDRDTIKLTLKEDAIKTSGTYNFTVQNVSDVAGNVMNAVTQAKSFRDNSQPALTSAVLTSNNTTTDSAVITLTFDEAIASASVVDANVDFAVFVDGVATTATVTEGMGSSTNQVTLTLNRALTVEESTKTLSVKPGANFAVTDLAGNLHPTFTSVTVSK